MNKKRINEATGTMSSGKFKVPIVLSPEDWKENQLAPFTNPVYQYTNAELAYEESDGDFKESPEKRNQIERKTKKLSRLDQYLKNFYSGQNDEEGGNIGSVENPNKIINKTVGPLKEDLFKEQTTTSSGESNGPLQHGFRKWGKTSLSPFDIEVPHVHTHHAKKNKLDDIIVHHIKSLTEEKINEDLGVWFGTKKKPKGSSQPKGPWVNICRKKEGGGHPPCGRPDASDKGYPKCRAAGVAARMTDSQKRSACQQKRNAEKSHPKSGTGNKPKLTHYEPKNESIRNIIIKVLNEQFKK